MALAPTRIDAEKLTIVRDLFIATADDNYITVRRCHQEEEGLNIDFFWLAASTSPLVRIKALLLIRIGQASTAPPNVPPHT